MRISRTIRATQRLLPNPIILVLQAIQFTSVNTDNDHRDEEGQQVATIDRPLVGFDWVQFKGTEGV